MPPPASSAQDIQTAFAFVSRLLHDRLILERRRFQLRPVFLDVEQ